MHTTQAKPFTTNLLQEVTIAPHSTKEICIGIYESCIPQPRLAIKSTPNIGSQLTVVLEQKMGFGDYTLVYTIKNGSNTPCLVSITENEPHAGQRMV